MIYTLTIEIPGLPKLPNRQSKRGWKQVHFEGKRWKRDVMIMTLGKLPPKPLEKARVEFTRFAYGVSPDSDNLVMSFKPVRDGLVQCGVLADDSPEHIFATYTWERCGPRQGRIRVHVVEEVA